MSAGRNARTGTCATNTVAADETALTKIKLPPSIGWEMQRQAATSPILDPLMLAGWEPFAVVGELVYLKRPVP